MKWWKQPNAWLAIGSVAFLSATLTLEFSRARDVVEPTKQPRRVETLKPVIGETDVDIIGTADEEELLQRARLSTLTATNEQRLEMFREIERVRQLRDLYISKIQEHDARRGSKDASGTSPQERGSP